MLNTRPFYRRAQFWQYLIPFIFLVIWAVAFRQELWMLWRWLFGDYQLSTNPEVFPVERATLQVAALVLIFLVLYFLLLMFVTSQFVLPVQSWGDRLQVFQRLLLYFFGLHGPAAAVREGQQYGTLEELRNPRRGVIFVDLTSAVVLERQGFIMRAQNQRRSLLRSLLPPYGRRLRRINRAENEPNARAAGPGIVFTQAGERLRGVVSLRKQSKIRPNTQAFTRDGFGVSGNVVCVFTLGEPPEVIRMMYDGEEKPENLKAIKVDEKQDDRPGQDTRRRIQYVKSLEPDELDEADRQEVHRAASLMRQVPEPPARPERPVMTPYIFDERRVFNAVFGGARLLNENREEDWTDLPVRVAVEIFHNMVSVVAYDELYRPDDLTEFPLVSEMRPRFMRAVRNQGVLSYQLVRRRDRQLITQGMVWNEAELEIYPVTPLNNSRILRDRGIKVIVATFAELRPTNPLVLQQRFDTWRARWQGEAILGKAPYEREALLAFAQERALAQGEIIQRLYPMLNQRVAASEAIAISVLQSLENYASDSTTRQLLPQNTLDMMWSLRNWFQQLGPGGMG